jgi:hypothetical protein
MLKVVRDRNKIVRYFNKFLKVSAAAERLMFFFLIAILLMHNCACFWVMIGQAEDSPDSWINQFNYQDVTNIELYIAAFYFVVTTIATVGYGDISS